MKKFHKSERYKCSFVASLENSYSIVSCQAKDTSINSISARIASILKLEIHQKVCLCQEDLGRVNGVVVWIGMGEFGMTFNQYIQ